MVNPIVVDLSHHNPEPDWPALKAGGTQGVILKATQGTSFVDAEFLKRRNDALEAGLYVASYHFLEHGSIDAQMGHYVATVDPEAFERMVIDYEDYEDKSPTFDDLCRATYVLKGEGCEVAIYGGGKLKADLGNDYAHDLAGTSLWIAQYTDAAAPSWPKTQWPVWSLWQFTDAATCDGIGAPVDGNRWNGDPANLKAWFYRPDDAPQPEPDEVMVTIGIDAPDGVAVSILVNGVAYVAA